MDHSDTPSHDTLLTVRGLTLGFGSAPPAAEGPDGFTEVLRGVDLTLRRGELFALVGESGCGKSLTALSILGLLPPEARVTRGEVHLAGVGDLLTLPEAERRPLRGRRIGMIFQEPASALNPVLTIGFQIIESLRQRRSLGRRQARAEAQRLLERVAMPEPRERLDAYPHQLSGGQQQRAMIAMALACEPDLLLADEPTTALDVTVQAQVLDILLGLQHDLGLTVLLITHDLGVVAQVSDRVGVMYAGQVVEQAPVETLFARPQHPYTRALLASVPRLGSRDLPEGIPGQVPEPGQLPSGCAFHPRCAEALERCSRGAPPWVPVADDHRSRCVLSESSSLGEPGEGDP